jgi:glycosyltransferase involved in cell wall biosynthesis
MKQAHSPASRVLFLLPSLRLSGGVIEALRLAEELQNRNIPVTVLILWRSAHEVAWPNLQLIFLSPFKTTDPARLLQYLYLLARFLFLAGTDALRRNTRWKAIFLTHFSTFPLGWLVPWTRVYCFNQDIEWMFVPAGLRRTLLRWFILTTSRRSRVVTTNAYVDHLYRDHGIQPIAQTAIWARAEWLLGEPSVLRDIDVVMLVRRGHMKRLDLYCSVLQHLHADGIRTLAIAPDPDIHATLLPLASQAVLRPSDDELRAIYQRAKIFLLLSDTEGFALPPLEAMGAGCVPLCRDSGGPRCYMDGPLALNLIPLNADAGEIASQVTALLADPARLATQSAHAKIRFSEGLQEGLRQRTIAMEILGRQLRT